LGLLGAAGVGYYRAAAAVSVGYLAFLLNAMAQDYFPRLAGAPEADLSSIIERRARIVAAIAAPIIVCMLALSPLVVSLLYTDEFLPAVAVLQWQLIGDLMKLPAWALSFAILARASPFRFLSLEAIGGAGLVAGVLLITPVLGIAGAGLAYLLSYLVYYVAALVLVQSVVRIRPGRLQLSMLGLSAGCSMILVAIPHASLLRSVLLLLIAAGIAGVAWPRLWRHHRAGLLV
jgi:PST family polysaccharide transporter